MGLVESCHDGLKTFETWHSTNPKLTGFVFNLYKTCEFRPLRGNLVPQGQSAGWKVAIEAGTLRLQLLKMSGVQLVLQQSLPLSTLHVARGMRMVGGILPTHAEEVAH